MEDISSSIQCPIVRFVVDVVNGLVFFKPAHSKDCSNGGFDQSENLDFIKYWIAFLNQ